MDKLTAASVDQFLGEHGGTKEYARFMVCVNKINELVEQENKRQEQDFN